MIRLSESARAVIALCSIFLLGAVGGVVLDRTLLIPPHADAAAYRIRPVDHDAVLAELRTELGLSDEQSTQVREVFARHHSEIEQTWAEVHASVQRAMRTTTTELEGVLDSAQVERLHAWLARRHGQPPGSAPGLEH